MTERRRTPVYTAIDRRKDDSDYVERMSGGIHASIRSIDRADDRPARRPRTKKR